MNTGTFFVRTGWCGLAAVIGALAGCGGGGPAFEPYDNSAEVEAYYRADPDFFIFGSPADLPADLAWENGMDEPELGSPDAVKGGTFQGALGDFPRTLRHVGPDSNGSFRVFILDWVGMTFAQKHPETGRYFPGIAKEWALEKETNTVYVRIDPEARWSDGEPIDADDVFFSFYFRRSEHTRDPFGQHVFKTKHTRLVKYDDLTFSLTVAEAKPDYADWVLQFTAAPRHFYREFGEDYVERYQWRFVPTAGPYVVRPEDVQKGKAITLTRLDGWWAKDRKYYRHRFNPDKLELKVIRDPNKAFEAFKSGELDMARLNLSDYWYEKLADNDPLVQGGYVHKVTFFNEIPQSGYRLWLNWSKPPLDNRDVRIGLCHATNYQLVIDEFFRGDWVRERSAADGYGEVSRRDLPVREFSVEKALEHFAKAGFTTRGADGILVDEKGERLSFSLSTGYKTLADAMTILKQEAAKAGVEFEVEVLDATTGWKKSQEKKHEIALAGFASSPAEVYPRYWDFFHSDNAYREDGTVKPDTNNLCCVSLPELDELITQYDKSDDHAEKSQLAHRIEEIIYREAAFVPGVYPPSFRVGYWRWVKWPPGFSVRKAEIEEEWFLHWIDEAAKEETEAARKSGKTFEPVIRVFDQYRAP